MRSMDEEKEFERYEIVRNLVHTKLQETGDLDRLRCFVRRRLIAAGWKCDMMRELRVAVNEKGICNVSAQNLYDKITISGRKIDERVTEEALKKIKVCYKEALNEKNDKEINQKPDHIANDNLGNIRYINECRN